MKSQTILIVSLSLITLSCGVRSTKDSQQSSITESQPISFNVKVDESLSRYNIQINKPGAHFMGTKLLARIGEEENRLEIGGALLQVKIDSDPIPAACRQIHGKQIRDLALKTCPSPGSSAPGTLVLSCLQKKDAEYDDSGCLKLVEESSRFLSSSDGRNNVFRKSGSIVIFDNVNAESARGYDQIDNAPEEKERISVQLTDLSPVSIKKEEVDQGVIYSLEIKVEGVTLSPRQRIGTAPSN